MKPLLILTLTTAALCAQYVEILGTDYPAASLPQLNKKMASRVGSGAPTGACTPGLDFYLDSATTTAYVCPSGSWAALSGGGGGAVSSVYGRTGAVVAQTGDYSAAQITGLAAIAASGSASDLVAGTVPAARLGTGTANSTTFLRGDGAWATPAGGGSSTSACEIVIGDPGAATPILSDDNDAPALCANVSGSTQTITSIACWANVGTPTVRPIITGGASNSLLSADLQCGTQAYLPGTLNGTPTLSAGATIDANIASAGGVAKYIVIRIVRSN